MNFNLNNQDICYDRSESNSFQLPVYIDLDSNLTIIIPIPACSSDSSSIEFISMEKIENGGSLDVETEFLSFHIFDYVYT